MVLKDWKKYKNNIWYSQKDETQLELFKYKPKKFIVYNTKSGCCLFRENIIGTFKTKSQALLAIKRYMKTH